MENLNVVKVIIKNRFTQNQKWGGVAVWEDERPSTKELEQRIYDRAKIKNRFLYNLNLEFCEMTEEEILKVVLRNLEIERGGNYDNCKC